MAERAQEALVLKGLEATQTTKVDFHQFPGGNIANVVLTRFVLKHAVSINQSGQTVLFFLGAIAGMEESLPAFTRTVCWANAIAMIIGQLFYTLFWTIDEGGGMDRFLRPNADNKHGLVTFTDRCNIPRWVWLLIAAVYYLVFHILFIVAFFDSALPVGFFKSYIGAAILWHTWIVFLFVYSTLMGYCSMCKSPEPYDNKFNAPPKQEQFMA